MTPTPLFRPYSIQVSKKCFWALRTISKGLVGDGQLKPEFTADGVADSILTAAIEQRFPGLLDGYKRREQIDAEYQAMVQLGAKDAQADVAIIKSKEQKEQK